MKTSIKHLLDKSGLQVLALMLSLAGMALFSSCEKEIAFNGELKEPSLVLNAIVSPDSLIGAYVTESRFFLDQETKYKPIEEAEVLVYVDDVLRETMKHVAKGYYKASFAPKPGESIRLDVSSKGFPQVSSSTRIVDEPRIQTLDTVSTSKKNLMISQWGSSENDGPVVWHTDTVGYSLDKVYTLTLKMEDPEATKNYYRLQVNLVTTYDNGFKNYSSAQFEFTDIVSGNSAEAGGDIFDMGSSNNEYNIFTDELFNGRTYPLKFKITDSFQVINEKFGGNPNAINITSKELIVNIQSISKDYYLYLKTRAAAKNEDALFTEPVQIFNNIKGGLGILGTYTAREIRLPLPLRPEEI